ncbi:ATP-binding protein [Kaistella chaponensis]|nr:ATP-binding protein [Kaistella chaponensis]
MDYIQKLRIKTAMIVYELEKSLGNYVIENEAIHTISDSSLDSIIEREKNRGFELEKDNLNLIIEASYLDEIFNFAINITEGSSLNRSMIGLKQLCSILGIFDIRNAVSHPNRPFPDCYWFRAATIASDPLIEKLNLSSVRNALNSAIEENLNTPPDEWLHNVNWAIPNTLPQSFDHEITGLLGRDKEFKDLETVLSKKRNNLIAIVAPGGIGKTALVLQYLKDLSLNPSWADKLSSIVFCTLKNEKLTADGIEAIDAIVEIEQIKETIFHDLLKLYSDKYTFTNFEEAVEILEEENILICIDNLETLLVDFQNEFIDFNQSLPIKWKLLVTSRISIDSATTVPLDPLGKRHAVNLSRNYLKKRGVVDFKQEDLERIADAANNNPLAIKLTIDLYLKGGDISSSITRSQKDIASFSYKNLIEALKENSITILESIYAIGNPTKNDLIDFLNINREEIIESINELSKTSLVIRSTDEYGNDTYKLSDSIRDLLLINPKNIEVRNNITEDIKKRKAKILEQASRIKQLGLNEFDDDYIPEDLEPNSYSLITDLNKALSKASITNVSELIKLKERFAEYLRFKTNDWFLLFNYSRIFRELKDTSNELLYLQKAQEFNSGSPKIKLAIALRYFYNSDYLDAIEYFEQFINEGYDNPLKSNTRFSHSITKLYYLCLIYLGEFDKILEITSDWKEKGNWSGVVGVSRATALKRKIEYKYYSVNTNEKLISEILEILDSIFKSDGYFDTACVESNKIIKDSDFLLKDSYNYSSEIKLKYLNFVSNHYFNIISKLRNENINSNDNQLFINNLYVYEITDNPIRRVKWFKHEQEPDISYDLEHIEELKNEGFEVVKVYHIPEDRGYGMSSFMFAENDDKKQFYLSVNFLDEGWNRWGYIKEGNKLAIKYRESGKEDKPHPATKIIEIDTY